MKIIGVIGQNGSGKDEVLKYLRAEYQITVINWHCRNGNNQSFRD